MNTYSVISAGSLSLLQGIHGERVIELTLILALCLLSLVGLMSSLRLKAELEECLEKIEAMVARAQVDEFVALGRPEGRLLRYPAFARYSRSSTASEPRCSSRCWCIASRLGDTPDLHRRALRVACWDISFPRLRRIAPAWRTPRPRRRAASGARWHRVCVVRGAETIPWGGPLVPSPIDTAKPPPESPPAMGSTQAEAGDRAAGRRRRRRLWLLVGALAVAAVAGAAYWYYWLRQPPLSSRLRLRQRPRRGHRVRHRHEACGSRRRGARARGRSRGEGPGAGADRHRGAHGAETRSGGAARAGSQNEGDGGSAAPAAEERAGVRAHRASPRGEAGRGRGRPDRAARPGPDPARDRRSRRSRSGGTAERGDGVHRGGRGDHPEHPALTRRQHAVSPIHGRVQYRPAEPGEVLGAGGAC